MGSRGPKEASPKLKVVRGDRKSRQGATPPPSHPGSRTPACPSWLHPYARAVWRELGPGLHKVGRLEPEDRYGFATYCQAVAIERMAAEELTRLQTDDEGEPVSAGVLVPSYRGQRVKHPALQIFRDAAGVVRAFGMDFGLTPDARQAPPVSPPDAVKARLLS